MGTQTGKGPPPLRGVGEKIDGDGKKPRPSFASSLIGMYEADRTPDKELYACPGCDVEEKLHAGCKKP